MQVDFTTKINDDDHIICILLNCGIYSTSVIKEIP